MTCSHCENITVCAICGKGYAEAMRVQPWQPIETAPQDELILVATTGDHVDTAHWTDDGDGVKWWWSPGRLQQLHSNLIPTHWMPLPKHPGSSS